MWPPHSEALRRDELAPRRRQCSKPSWSISSCLLGLGLGLGLGIGLGFGFGLEIGLGSGLG